MASFRATILSCFLNKAMNRNAKALIRAVLVGLATAWPGKMLGKWWDLSPEKKPKKEHIMLMVYVFWMCSMFSPEHIIYCNTYCWWILIFAKEHKKEHICYIPLPISRITIVP